MDILERMNEREVALRMKNEENEQDKAIAEEMRKKATERLGETKRRHSEEKEELLTTTVRWRRKRLRLRLPRARPCAVKTRTRIRSPC